MNCFIGVDVGTSSTKSLLMQEDGTIIGTAQKKYNVLQPHEGYSEQNIDELWEAACWTLQELSRRYPLEVAQVRGIGYSGQMHGLVMLDKALKPIRNCIIWNDQRSVQEIEKIHAIIAPEEFNRVTLNQLSTGYLVSSLYWVKEHEPENFERMHVLMLPKDYIRLRMTGEVGTEMTDASSAVIFDTAKREWAWDFIDRLGFPREAFPACHEAYEVAGQLTQEAAALTGLPAGIPVVYGGGDTLMHEVGCGMISEDRPWVANIGTSCQVTCAMQSPGFDRQYRTNTFCQVKEDLWMLMSCNLCGGAAMKWLSQNVYPGMDFVQQTDVAKKAEPGSKGLIFLPYLTGARSPDVDPRARGMFMGLTLGHGQEHLVRATIEGVIYSLRNAYETLKSITGREPDSIIASGGGARGELLLQIEADMFNKPVYTTVEAEQSCIGACLTAAVGTGYYSSFEQACDAVVRFHDRVVEPVAEHVQIYDMYFEIYRELYRCNKPLFDKYPR